MEGLEDEVDGLRDTEFVGWEGELGFFRFLVRGGDAGELLDFLVAGLGVEALGVAFLADIERGLDEDFHELVLEEHGADLVPVFAVGGDERGDADEAGIGEELGDLTYAADVFLAFMGGEAEVGAQAMADVIAIEDVGVFAEVKEFAFQFGGNGGFT
jgi:hypothetical protein